MDFSILSMLSIMILLPAIFFIALWRGKFRSRIEWLFLIIMVGLLVSHLFLSGRWDFPSYYLRVLLLIMFFIVAIISYMKVRKLNWRTSQKKWGYKFTLGFYILLSLFFGLQVAEELSGYFYQKESVQLQFPLKNGVSYVAHGGNSPSINYHQANAEQSFAMDIVRLNEFGTRTKGISPEQFNKYEVYGDKVYSPCAGKIIELEDGLKQIPPSQMNSDTLGYRNSHPEGDHVYIQCQGVNVLLAHMIPGSIAVEENDKVREGEKIGQVGNSGNTSEPHLHIHAEKNGDGVPITFDGRFLKRNSLIFPK